MEGYYAEKDVIGAEFRRLDGTVKVESEIPVKGSAAMQRREDHCLDQGCRSECGGGGWVPEVFRAGEQ